MNEHNFETDIKKCFFKTINEEWSSNIHKRTFVSRIAYHLADIIENEGSKIKVNVEYNRNVDDSKRVNEKLRFVDLIIHERKINF